MSDLVAQSGVPLATVKFYIREQMLPAGTPIGPTRASYSDEHLHRLRLIRSLTVVAGLPLSRTREILAVLDQPDGSVVDMLGRAVSALVGTAPEADETGTETPSPNNYPLARAAITHLGGGYEPQMPALAQLDAALLAVEEAGMPATPDRLATYGPHIRAIAEAEVASVPSHDASAAVEYAVLGTVLYEPVLAALRRLAHQNIASRQDRSSKQTDSSIPRS
jgi:DNA-binding transcriptional MerR regulator